MFQKFLLEKLLCGKLVSVEFKTLILKLGEENSLSVKQIGCRLKMNQEHVSKILKSLYYPLAKDLTVFKVLKGLISFNLKLIRNFKCRLRCYRKS